MQKAYPQEKYLPEKFDLPSSLQTPMWEIRLDKIGELGNQIWKIILVNC